MSSRHNKYAATQQDENMLKIKRLYVQLEKEPTSEDDGRETPKYQVLVEPGGKRAKSRSQSRASEKDNSLLGPIFETCRSASTCSPKWYCKKEVGTRSGLQTFTLGRFWSTSIGMSLDPGCKIRRQNRSGKPSKAWWRAHARLTGAGHSEDDQYTDVSGAAESNGDSAKDGNADDQPHHQGRPSSIDSIHTLDSSMPASQPETPTRRRDSNKVRRTFSRESNKGLGGTLPRNQSLGGSLQRTLSVGNGKVDRRTLLGEARKTLLKEAQAPSTPKKNQVRFGGSILEDDESKTRRSRVHSVCLEWKGGILVPQTPQDRLREDVKLMEKKMQDSMTGSFHTSVWEECGLQQKVKVTVNDRPDVSFMYDMTNGAGLMGEMRKRNRMSQETVEMEKDELMIASLAKKTGMSVLDVEEIFEVFQKYDLDGEGRIHVDGPAFELLIKELGQDPKTSEVVKMREDLDISVDGCADFVDFYLVFMHYLSANRKL